MIKKLLKSLPKLPEGKNVCVALSGGLDSTTLLYLLVYKYGANRVKTLSFDYGQRHRIELDMAMKTTERLGIEHRIIELNYLKDLTKSSCALIEGSCLEPKTIEENAGNPQVNTYVAWRNAQFAYITAAYAETNDCIYIFQGLNQVDLYSYFDTSLDFIKSINNTLKLNRQNSLKILAPFVQLYKEDELKLALQLSSIYGYDILEYTWSCYNGANESGKECGNCCTCSEKLKGYITAGYTVDQILNKFNIEEIYLNELISMYTGECDVNTK